MTKIGHITTGFGLAIILGFDPITAVFGSILPDKDLLWGRTTGYRTLWNAHRGITHHLFIGIFFLILAFLLKGEGVYHLVSSFLFGYAVHIFTDMLTPLGIPYTTGYYPRLSLNLFETGSLKEQVFIIVFTAAVGFYLYENQHVFTQTMRNSSQALTEVTTKIIKNILKF